MKQYTFKDFLNETLITDESLTAEEAAEIIKTKCQKYTSLVGDIRNNRLYRGTKIKFSPKAIVRQSRDNRRPLTMNKKYHEVIDDFFEQKFGIKFRSSGLFSVANSQLASSYGDLHIIFPIGNFDYCWSEDYRDMYHYIETEVNYKIKDPAKTTPEELKSKVGQLLEDTEFHFNDNSLKKYFGSDKFKRHEMMIRCDEYLIIREEFFQNILDIIGEEEK